MVKDEQSGTNESAQLQQKHEKFLSKLEEKMQKENFTEEQRDVITSLAKECSPGDRDAIKNIADKFQQFFEANKQSEASEPDETESSLPESRDFAEFVIFAKATQIIPSDAEVEEFSEREQSDFVSKYKLWLKNGKPAAVNPLGNEEPEKILRLARVKAFGKQKLTAVIKGKDIPMGVELVPEYRKYRENGVEKIDKTKVLSHKVRYTIDYTDKLAAELVKRCENEAENPEFTFKEGGRTIYIRDYKKNFTRDFDEVMKDSRAGIPV